MVWGVEVLTGITSQTRFETYGLVKVMGGSPPYEGPGPNQLYSKTVWEPTRME